MIILAILLQTLSFYMFYNTSRRVRLSRDRFSSLMQKERTATLIGASILLLISFATAIAPLGFAVGLFAGMLSLMTIASLMILFVPLIIKES